MRATFAILLTAALAGLSTMPAPSATAAARPAVAAPGVTEVSAQQRRRPRVRIYRQSDDRGVIPSYFPGSNAVRACTVNYVQEYRPSGTVIVPRMNCVWRRP